MSGSLRAPLTDRSLHLCIDMQNIFSQGGIWPTPWMTRVVPVVSEIAGRFPARTIFTRFITPRTPKDMHGTWRRYYERWRAATREQLDPQMLELLPQLQRFVPPAILHDKMTYSAFADPRFALQLRKRETDALIITGSETEVCVLATVLGAVDFGYRVIVVRDAVCSSSDDGHDAQIGVYQKRYSEQIEVADAETVLAAWPK